MRPFAARRPALSRDAAAAWPLDAPRHRRPTPKKATPTPTTVSRATASLAPPAPSSPSSSLATAVEPPSPREAEASTSESSGGSSRSDRGRTSPSPPPPPPSTPPPPKKGANFYANVGTAVRRIREDLPALFQRDMDFSIYRDDVVFRDPRNSFHGIDNYRTIFWSVRFHGNLFFRDLRVEVSRIWQPEPREIRVRWAARGVSRLPWRPVGVFDGISTFKLDEEGMIYVHEVNNVVLRPPPRSVLSPLFVRLNLVPAGSGGGGGLGEVVEGGIPTGGGGACPGWRGEALGFVEGEGAEADADGSDDERRRRRSRALPPSLSSLASLSPSASGEDVLVLRNEGSYRFLSSRLSTSRRGEAEGEVERDATATREPSYA